VLVSFSIENWMSFRDRVTFSMVASREKQHQETLSSVEGYPMRLLPVAAIYGGNASGKTNLFKALSLARRLVVDGTKPEGKIRLNLFVWMRHMRGGRLVLNLRCTLAHVL